MIVNILSLVAIVLSVITSIYIVLYHNTITIVNSSEKTENSGIVSKITNSVNFDYFIKNITFHDSPYFKNLQKFNFGNWNGINNICLCLDESSSTVLVNNCNRKYSKIDVNTEFTYCLQNNIFEYVNIDNINRKYMFIDSYNLTYNEIFDYISEYNINGESKFPLCQIGSLDEFYTISIDIDIINYKKELDKQKILSDYLLENNNIRSFINNTNISLDYNCYIINESIAMIVYSLKVNISICDDLISIKKLKYLFSEIPVNFYLDSIQNNDGNDENDGVNLNLDEINKNLLGLLSQFYQQTDLINGDNLGLFIDNNVRKHFNMSNTHTIINNKTLVLNTTDSLIEYNLNKITTANRIIIKKKKSDLNIDCFVQLKGTFSYFNTSIKNTNSLFNLKNLIIISILLLFLKMSLFFKVSYTTLKIDYIIKFVLNYFFIREYLYENNASKINKLSERYNILVIILVILFESVMFLYLTFLITLVYDRLNYFELNSTCLLNDTAIIIHEILVKLNIFFYLFVGCLLSSCLSLFLYIILFYIV